MNTKVILTLVCLALAAPAMATEVRAADTDTTPPTPAPPSDNDGGSSTVQCNPACVPPEFCCVLSGLEAACATKDECFTAKKKLKTK